MKIYIACPASFASGGPELLHQLCYKLIQAHYDACICYYKDPQHDNGPLVHKRYEKYNLPYTTQYIDAEDSVLIVPEVILELLAGCHRGLPVVWWLSVDLFVHKYSEEKINEIFDQFRSRKEPIFHLAQSCYAENFLLNLAQIPSQTVRRLSDYLRQDFLAESGTGRLTEKKNWVLYNPLKGIDFTRHLMAASGDDITYVPLSGYTPQEMADVLKTAKVYIDFGPHPGKDRIPREAAICGCCVITGRLGSAAYPGDVPIPERYKIDGTEENIPEVLECIQDIFDHYESLSNDFTNYRDIIRREEEMFDEDMKNIFTEMDSVVHGRAGGSRENKTAKREIEDLINSGSLTTALDLVQQYLTQYDYDDDTALYMASISQIMGLDDYMTDHITRGLTYNPFNYELFLMLGEYGEKQGHYKEALDCYDKAAFLSLLSPEDHAVIAEIKDALAAKYHL